jgi:K+-sensing histidine kinase KdpD
MHADLDYAIIGHEPSFSRCSAAAAWFDFFFTLPYYRFTIRNSSDVTTAVLLLAVGIAVSQLAARARKLKVMAITDEGYLALIHETGVLAQSARSAGAVVDQVREQLIVVLGLAGCRFEYGSLLGHPPRLEPDGVVMAGHIRARGSAAQIRCQGRVGLRR